MKALRAIRSMLARLLAPEDYYEAARYSTRRSRLPGSGLQSARFDISQAPREKLAEKSRYWERNSAIVNQVADIWERCTVGSGPRLQPASSDAEWNKAAADFWNYWCELPDISTRQNFATCLGLGSRHWCIDGEALVVLVRGESGTPRIQMIEPHLLRTPTEKANDADILDGMRLDPLTLRPLSYFLHTEKIKSRDATWREVDNRYVVHWFEPSRVGQLRGLPMFHAALNILHDLEDLHLLEMSAAKDAAKTSKVIKRAASSEFNPATLAAARLTGSLPTAAGGSVETSKLAYYDDVLGEGRVILQPGDEYFQFDSKRPSVITREYWRYLTEQVCAAVGIPYVLAFPDSMQGTVYRGALDSAAAFFSCRFSVIEAVIKRIYAYVMGWARYTQPLLVDAPADWQKVRIAPPRAVNVDVGRNSQALLQEISAGTSTFSRAYSSLGLDWREELRQKAEEARYIRDLAKEFDVDPAEISNIQVDRPERIKSEAGDQAPATVPVEGDQVTADQTSNA